MSWKNKYNQPPRVNPVMEYGDGTRVFTVTMGEDTGEGTYGSFYIFVKDIGTLIVQIYNYEEAAWWVELCKDVVEVETYVFTPAPDQKQTRTPFEPPTDITFLDIIPR